MEMENELEELNPEFALNPDPRCACVLLLDTSASMKGKAISELNNGLKTFRSDLSDDPLASRRVEIAIVAFGKSGVTKIQDFVTADQFAAPELSADGKTPMGEAINLALDLVSLRKADYKENGISYYQPWVLLITDGAPTDDWKAAAQRVQTETTARRLTFFAVGVQNADMEVLSQITSRTLKLDGLRFNDLFVWLSQSQKRVSSSKPGDQTALPPVTFGAPIAT
jgi:uncharacterized protein YegL